MGARWYRTAASAVVLLFALLLAGPALAVTITSFTPTTDWIPEDPGNCVGTSITINGTGFVTDGGPVTVTFNNKAAVNVVIGSDSVIYAKMPPGTIAGNVTVTTAKGTATSSTGFTVVPCAAQGGPALIATSSATTAKKAAIASFAPTKAKAGAKITITGRNFTGATGVKIGGAAAAFKVVSATKITATVPAKARSGKITVTTAAGTATSSTSFTKL
jgi:hypothetical protein